MDIIQMSLSASVLIVAVVVIRAITLHKLPKKTFLALWGATVFRLLVPFSIPSRFSIYTGIHMVKQIFAEKAAESLPGGIFVIPDRANLPGTVKPVGISGIRATALSMSPFELIWLAGLCVCALFFTAAYIKCCREFKMSLPVSNSFAISWLREHPLYRSVQIRQSDRIKAPLTYGVFRPVILLPKKTDWTDETDLRYILTHELVHIRHFDTLIKLVLTAAVCVHWFNPFVWVMYVLANRDIELSCDETVVRTFGVAVKSAYALTLIGLEEKKSSLTPLVNNFSKNSIEERIISIMKIKKTSLMGAMLALVLIAGTITVFATNTANAAAAGDPPADNSITTSETASAVALSYTDESGNTQMSADNGKTWMSEEEFEKAYPTPEVEWWAYEEYKAWLDNEKVQLQDMIGEKSWNPTEGWYVWTQERVNEAVKRYEGILEDIKNGMYVSKTVNGSEDGIMISCNPSDIEAATGYTICIVNDNGEEALFGPYSTKEEMLTEVKPYCEKQVKAGNMSQQEADEIISKYQ